jgi:hypothetical protein
LSLLPANRPAFGICPKTDKPFSSRTATLFTHFSNYLELLLATRKSGE